MTRRARLMAVLRWPLAKLPPWPKPYTAIHFFLALVLFNLCLTIGAEGSIFAGNRTYALFAQWGSEAAWAWFYGIVAAVGAAGAFSRYVKLRWWSAQLVAATHALTGAFFYAGNPTSTGAGTYTVISLLGYYLLGCLVSFRGNAPTVQAEVAAALRDAR